MIELDRNPDNFESFLEQASLSGPDQLTVGHVRRFVPCTSNLDPYLRKLIRGLLYSFILIVEKDVGLSLLYWQLEGSVL